MRESNKDLIDVFYHMLRKIFFTWAINIYMYKDLIDVPNHMLKVFKKGVGHALHLSLDVLVKWFS